MKWAILEPPQHPHNPKLCAKRSISAQEVDTKKHIFLQKIFFRIIFHIFRDVKTRNFEDFGHVFAIYNRESFSKSMDFRYLTLFSKKSRARTALSQTLQFKPGPEMSFPAILKGTLGSEKRPVASQTLWRSISKVEVCGFGQK